jgi:phage pi2 protein 07
MDGITLSNMIKLVNGLNINQKTSIISGGWYTYPSEKYEFISWDDSSQYMENITRYIKTKLGCSFS